MDYSKAQEINGLIILISLIGIILSTLAASIHSFVIGKSLQGFLFLIGLFLFSFLFTFIKMNIENGEL